MGTVCSGTQTFQGTSYTYNTGVNQLRTRSTWLTFAHELGHNWGGDHSFEEGQGRTGGIMDYGDGKLNGAYQFNTRYRKGQMCQQMSSTVNQCQGKFVRGGGGGGGGSPPRRRSGGGGGRPPRRRSPPR